MTKEQAIARAGSKAKLARLLGVTKSAVSQWGDELPELQRYRLKELKPRWFSEARRQTA